MYDTDSPTVPVSPWHKPETAAAYAGVSINVLSRAARRGDLASSKVGKARLYRLEDIDAWLVAHRQGAS